MNKRIDFDFGGKKKAAIAKKKGLAKGLAAGVAAGSALGALGGLLFAPKSGKETRDQIADDVSDAAKKAVSDIKDAGEKAAGSIKDLAAKANELINEKIIPKNHECCETCCAEEEAVDEEDIVSAPDAPEEEANLSDAELYSNENMEKDVPEK